LAEIIALEAEKVEGDKRGLLAARLGAESGKVGMAVREERHRFAVDQGIVDGQGTHRLRDLRKPAGEICAVTGPQRDVLALLPGENAESVVLHLMQPAPPGGRIGD
jgi:hypothetical protein